MKQILIILMLLTSGLAKCQNVNIISSIEYNSIKVNDVKLSSIKNTKGILQNVVNLFGNPISKEIDPDGDFFHYNYNNFSISYSSIISDGTFDNPILSKIKINSKLEIKGVEIKIGEKIDKLGNVKINTNSDGSYSILFMECDGCNNFISIDFDKTTNVITKIQYVELT